MELSPQKVRAMSFSTVKRGYDTSEVNSFIAEVAVALEASQNDTRAMEARARAAVARLQELSQASPAATGDGGDGAPGEDEASREIVASVDESETISRTLLLAQRTADTTVAEAQAEAERLLAAARDDAAQSLDQARSMADQLVEDAKEAARNEGEGERVRVQSEVQALGSRRNVLESDVDTLEGLMIEQRERIRESATILAELVERVPGGLGAMRRPSLSPASPLDEPAASDDDDGDDDTQPYERTDDMADRQDADEPAHHLDDVSDDDEDEFEFEDDLDDLDDSDTVDAPADHTPRGGLPLDDAVDERRT